MIKKLTYFFFLLILILPLAESLPFDLDGYDKGFLEYITANDTIYYNRTTYVPGEYDYSGNIMFCHPYIDNAKLGFNLNNDKINYTKTPAGPVFTFNVDVNSYGNNFVLPQTNSENAIITVRIDNCGANYSSINFYYCSYISGCNSTAILTNTNLSVENFELNITNYLNHYLEEEFYINITSSGGIFSAQEFVYFMTFKGMESFLFTNLSYPGNILLNVVDITTNDFIDDVTTTSYYNSLTDTRTFNKTTIFNLGNYNLNTIISASGYSSTNALLLYNSDYLIPYTYYLTETTYLAQPVIYIRDQYEQSLPNSRIIIKRASDDQLIYDVLTDISGSYQFDLDERLEYKISVSRSGFQTLESILGSETFYPIESTYFLTLLSEGSTPPTNLELGRFFSWTPIGNNLNSNTAYNITYNITNATSEYVEFTNISLSVYDEDGEFINIYYVNSTNESFVTIPNFNTSNYSKIFIVAELNINNSFLYQQRQYLIHQTYTGDYSLASVRTILNQFTDSGFDNNTRNLIGIMILLIVMIGTGTLVVTEADTSKALLLFFSLTLLLSYFNLLSMNLIIDMDAQLGGDAAKTMWNQYGISIIVGIFALGKLIKELNIQR